MPQSSAPSAEQAGDVTFAASRPLAERRFWPLAALFGGLYFSQALGEPTDGLVSQPVRSLLMSWGKSAGEITTFSALIALPWSLKPLYGLMSDFFPLAGYRRKSYLVLTSLVSAAVLLTLWLLPLTAADGTLLFALLLVPTTGMAFADVAIDGLMVEQAQPRGWTGQLQSVQWTAAFAAMALTGVVGGHLSEHHREQLGFALCGGACLVAMMLSILAPESRAGSAGAPARPSGAALLAAWRRPELRATTIFLFLWNFNPFSVSVLHIYMVRELELSQNFFGQTITIDALAAMAGAAAYGLLRSRIAFRWLLHGSIVLGIASTAAYWALEAEPSARWVSAGAGFATAMALLIQLDLAAQVCPLDVAGTVFAVLMSTSNLSVFLATWIGGIWYDRVRERLGPHLAFDILVGIGSLTTAACWFVLPALQRALEQREQPARP